MKLTPDEISPITGNLCVFVEYDVNTRQNTKLCMESGYHTYESWILGNEQLELFESKSPQFITDSKFIEPETNQVWYKITMLTDSAILCPEDNGWKVNSFRDLFEDETPSDKLQRVTKNILGEDVIQVLDENWASNFSEEEFEDSLIEFYKRCSNG